MLCSLFSERYLLWHLFVLVTVFTFSGGAIFRQLCHNDEICRLPHDRVKIFLQRIGINCFLFPNQNLFFPNFSDFDISLKLSRNWITFPISIWKEKKKKWVFVSLNHFSSQQRCFLPSDDESFVRLIFGGVLPVFSGAVFPLDSYSSGRYFVLVQFLEQILTVLLWKTPPWNPPWKGVRDFGFGSEIVFIFSAYKTSQNQIWVSGISNSDVGDEGVMLWPDCIKKSRLSFNSTIMKSYISVRKRFAISNCMPLSDCNFEFRNATLWILPTKNSTPLELHSSVHLLQLEQSWGRRPFIILCDWIGISRPKERAKVTIFLLLSSQRFHYVVFSISGLQIDTLSLKLRFAKIKFSLVMLHSNRLREKSSLKLEDSSFSERKASLHSTVFF